MKMDARLPSGLKIQDTGGAYTLSVIGGKYKILIIYLLEAMETLRHNDLKRRVGGISFKMLSQTLKEMEADGLVLRTEYPQIPPRVEYCLTDRAKSLLPVINAMCDWGEANRRRAGRKNG